MKKPSLLERTEIYNLEANDFHSTLERYIFAAINNLFFGGAEKIQISDIANYIQENLTNKSVFEKENGIMYLQDCYDYSELENFRYYYKKLKKTNLLIEIQKTGREIDNFYCEDLLNPKYKEINEKFDRINIEEIIQYYKTEVNELERKYVVGSLAAESKAEDTITELVDDLMSSPEIGASLQGDYFSHICRGARKGKYFLRSASSGVGKAAPNYTKIPTPNGWTTIGEIKAGDYLFDRFGKPTKVLAVYPQKEKKQIYKVYFKSGRVAECCNEHLWSYYSNLNDKNPNKLITSTLQEIIDNPKGLKNNKGAYRWSIPVCEPVQYSEKILPIKPYIMGLILGDGSFRYKESNKSFSFSSNDEELVKSIAINMGYNFYKKHKGNDYSWYFESNFKNHKNVWVEDILKDYPELWDKKSEDKFIPKEFLYGSVEQRFDLLAGLLDTDGSIDKKGRINFTTISLALRDNVIELCESLGMTCSFLVDKRTEKYTTGECYRIDIKAIPESKKRMFKLKRKIELVYEYLNNNKRKERKDRDSIIKIEATGKYTDMTCFYVDNDEHLFLMNDYICTHNTRNMVGDACFLAYPKRFDLNLNKWVDCGETEKVLYIMTEQDPDEIKTMVLSYLTGINEEKFLYAKLNQMELVRVKEAIKIIKENPNLFFAHIPDPCSSIVKNVIRNHYYRFEIEHFFYDYIFSSPALLAEYKTVAEHVALRLLSTTLKNLAVELNSFIMSSTQISIDRNDRDGFKDEQYLQGSRAIANVIDFGCIMTSPSVEEVYLTKKFYENTGIQPNLITDVYKNRRGKYTKVRIFSYVDLGTCRKQDLFVTDSLMKKHIDVTIIDFLKIDSETGEVLNYNNKNTDFVISALQDSVELIGQIETDEESRKRLHEKDLSDFL